MVAPAVNRFQPRLSLIADVENEVGIGTLDDRQQVRTERRSAIFTQVDKAIQNLNSG